MDSRLDYFDTPGQRLKTLLKLRLKCQLHPTCSIVKTPCDTLNKGKGSPIRQNPYKNKNQTLSVNGITHFGGTI